MFTEYEDCFVWSCDTCHKEVFFKPNNFMDCVAELHARGWIFTRDDPTWRHTCQRCQYKHQQTNIMDRTFKSVK